MTSATEETLKLGVISVILPSILEMIQLRRTMPSIMPLMKRKVRIDFDISLYRITTVDIAMNFKVVKIYERIHYSLFNRLTGEDDDEPDDSEKSRLNMRVHRLLCHAVLNSELHKFVFLSYRIAVENDNF